MDLLGDKIDIDIIFKVLVELDDMRVILDELKMSENIMNQNLNQRKTVTYQIL